MERQDFFITCNYFRGLIKFSFPTYFVPYLLHSCVLANCATRLPEIDHLLLLVSVSYGSCKPLLDYAPMEHPSMLQIVLLVLPRP
jgi:hypothetical protein